MAKFRVWAESISDVYLDVEAETEEQAMLVAEEADGGDFTEDIGGGEWRFGSVLPLDDDAEVDFEYKEFFGID